MKEKTASPMPQEQQNQSREAIIFNTDKNS